MLRKPPYTTPINLLQSFRENKSKFIYDIEWGSLNMVYDFGRPSGRFDDIDVSIIFENENYAKTIFEKFNDMKILRIKSISQNYFNDINYDMNIRPLMYEPKKYTTTLECSIFPHRWEIDDQKELYDEINGIVSYMNKMEKIEAIEKL